MKGCIGLLEVASWSLPALLADGACRHAPVQLLGMEATGGDSVVVKLGGRLSALESALEWCREIAGRLGVSLVATLLPKPEGETLRVLFPPNQIQPLYEHREQFLPSDHPEHSMNNTNLAVGILETQGLTAALEASDAMLKAAEVNLVGKEKIGAAYVAILIRGEVAAVKAAIDVGRQAAQPLGKVVAAHVIARPHPDFLKLLPS